MSFFTELFTSGSALLLILSVAVVGVLHTIVPDHWAPITLIARERKWTRMQTAKAALTAGTGHVVTTLILGGIVWLAGVAVAVRFGHYVDLLSSIALISFGLWIAIASWREMHKGHGHSHDFGYLAGSIHGPELQEIQTPEGLLKASIFEHDMPPHFRLTGKGDSFTIETVREGDVRQVFKMETKGDYWQSVESIPEPHDFSVVVTVSTGGNLSTYSVHFAEHSHDHGHDHASQKSGKNTRTALLLILGSSPMIEGIPAFFAAGKYGIGVIIVMALVFALSTIATYVLLCVYSTAGMEHIQMGALEKYGEVISGLFIATIGLVFLVFPVL
jgi:hypothetical protein